MHQNNSGRNSNVSKSIQPEQFDQLVEAILAGKYSWACVLMLRFAGYNPLHYIPYRTYNRLLKEHSGPTKIQQTKLEKLKQSPDSSSNQNFTGGYIHKIKDISYLETISNKNSNEVRSDYLDKWLSAQVSEY
ncbi:HetP family heterocyst commitment protein [Richelia intracellularis]|uniref:HetP family heterocyst commitment protein n=1 Tax=Richelia intracellularis TaxID=1164990 RepID=UPI00034916D6|nr:HetP family heterocyst commitment protein [Richelia intracellularis]